MKLLVGCLLLCSTVVGQSYVPPVIVATVPANTARCQHCGQEAVLIVMCDDIVIYCCARHVPQLYNAARIEIVLGGQ